MVEGECLRELPLSVMEERPVEALLTPLVLSASLCWVLLLRSWERERLWWPGLRTSKAFLRADMAAFVCWVGSDTKLEGVTFWWWWWRDCGSQQQTGELRVRE